MAKLEGDLGPLERAIMEVLWTRDAELSVREVLESRAGRRYAYTTIMTVMDRLWQKGYAARRMQGRTYIYRARRTREQYLEALMSTVLARADDRRSALLGFVRTADSEDLIELRRAIRQVEKERRTKR